MDLWLVFAAVLAGSSVGQTQPELYRLTAFEPATPDAAASANLSLPDSLDSIKDFASNIIKQGNEFRNKHATKINDTDTIVNPAIDLTFNVIEATSELISKFGKHNIATIPKISMPHTIISEMKVPEILEIIIPDVKIPDVPEVNAPEVIIPGTKISGRPQPDAESNASSNLPERLASIKYFTTNIIKQGEEFKDKYASKKNDTAEIVEPVLDFAFNVIGATELLVDKIENQHETAVATSDITAFISEMVNELVPVMIVPSTPTKMVISEIIIPEAKIPDIPEIITPEVVISEVSTPNESVPASPASRQFSSRMRRRYN